jgi:large subunit ribosomal protein L15
MQLHDIQPKNRRKKKKRIGRGGGKGTYCGKGVKGQKSRAGNRIRPELRDFVKKVPKLKGYRFKRYKRKSKKRKVKTDKVVKPAKKSPPKKKVKNKK